MPGVIANVSFYLVFKEGVTGIPYFEEELIPGQVFAGREKGRPLDLFMDLRPTIATTTMPPGREDPTKITIPFMRNTLHTFARSRQTARFSFLKVWTAPHFYPLMIGLHTRIATAFTDVNGRSWEWKLMEHALQHHPSTRAVQKAFER